MYNIYTGC